MAKATPLLGMYILLIGFTFTLGELLKQIREFGTSSYLNDISFLIHLSLLDSSIQATIDYNKHEVSNIVQIPSRKEKHK